MLKRVESKIPYAPLPAEGFHDLRAVALGALLAFACPTAPVPVPEHPGLPGIPVRIPAAKDLEEALGHGNSSGSQVTTFFLPSVKHQVPALEIDIIPGEPIDFA